MDIESTIEAYTFYVGFTGYMNDKSMELNLWEIFVFEENFDISKFNDILHINNKYCDTY